MTIERMYKPATVMGYYISNSDKRHINWITFECDGKSFSFYCHHTRETTIEETLCSMYKIETLVNVKTLSY
jgi:hypothetical protein